MYPLTSLLPSRAHWSRAIRRIHCTRLPSSFLLQYGPACAFHFSLHHIWRREK
jgi:hypothetical protein